MLIQIKFRWSDTCKEAYIYADAMLKAREEVK